MKLKDIEQLTATEEVQAMLTHLEGLAKPKAELAMYLNKVANIYKYDNDVLEKYLSIYSAWQNYLSEQVTIADTVKTVAESQKKYFYSSVLRITKGANISEKKEKTIRHPKYQQALQVAIETDSIHKAVFTKFENCERAYRLVSRILAKRINIRQLD